MVHLQCQTTTQQQQQQRTMKKIWKVKTTVPTCAGCVFNTHEHKVLNGTFRCEKRNIRAAQVDLDSLFERINFTYWMCGDDYIFVAKPPKSPKPPKTANEKKHDFSRANAKRAEIMQRRHAVVLELHACGLRVCEIAVRTGYTSTQISKIIRKNNQQINS